MKFGYPRVGRKVFLHMKKPSVALYLLAAALLCLVSGVNASADIIDLADHTGPDNFAAASAQTLTYNTSSGR